MDDDTLETLPPQEASAPTPDLFEAAKAVLEANDRGDHTIPAEGLYPHQWLWDSCFIAIGLMHIDIDRAKTELLSLLQGQWHNGMLPHMLLSNDPRYARDTTMWRSSVNAYSPDNIATSGITQPPMLAEAVVRIGNRLKKSERRTWYKQVFPSLLRYHQWLYADRDPHNEGLVLLVHPWECGLDNTPPWMEELHNHQMATWVRVVEKLKLDKVIGLFRRDTKFVPAGQRENTIEALALYSAQRRLRRKGYDTDQILTHSLFSIEDLSFNCIFIRANQHMRDIAAFIKEDLPDELLESMHKTEAALEDLFDPYTGQYYSRNFVTHNLLKESSIATLLPLYSGAISKERAAQLVRLLENQHVFGAHFPVPSVPLNSPFFEAHTYWQGPTWVNTNWLIIDGLERMGYPDHAAALRESTLDMVAANGSYEYFSAIDGSPAGAQNFSWTAALAIDLLKS